MSKYNPKTWLENVAYMWREFWAAFFVAVFVSLCSGCLWICRVPFPLEEKFSDEGECTNRVWRSMVEDCRMKFKANAFNNEWASSNGWWCAGCYPTIKMRCVATKSMYQPIDTELKGEDLYNARMTKTFGWIPLTVLWLTSPLDAIIDTLFIPHDIMKE